MLAYRGYEPKENRIATIGAIAAFTAALSPTACDGCDLGPFSIIHMFAGITLFGITAYFCLFPFYKRARAKPWDKAQLRAKWYRWLGLGIAAVQVVLIILGGASLLKFIITGTFMKIWTPIFWGEFAMLWMFGFAWAIAAKCMPVFVDEGKDAEGKDKDHLLDIREELGIPKSEKH